MKNLITSVFAVLMICVALTAICQPVQNSGEDEFEPGTLNGALNVSESGAAVYTIPLDLPPGRAGMTPGLGLVYNSQQGGNVLGKGWGLSGFSSITRTNPTVYYKGEADNIDFANDQLVLDGQKLIKVGEDEYILENDPSTTIEEIWDPEFYDYFIVRSGDGIVKEYGFTEDSRQEFSYEGQDACPLIWHINKVIDPQGNTILYEYTKNIEEGELHPLKIVYTGYEESGNMVQEGFYTIGFHYENLNNPALNQTFYCQKDTVEYMNLTSEILTSIEIRHTGDYNPFKEYCFHYVNNLLPNHSNILNDYFLNEILIKSYLEENEKVMKGASFDWAFYRPNYKTIIDHQDDHDLADWSEYANKNLCSKINISGTNKDDIAVSKRIFEDGNWHSMISVYYMELEREVRINVQSDEPVEPIAADVNFDGDEELVLKDDQGVKIYDFENDEFGNYNANIIYQDQNSNGTIKCGDVDGDGLTDIILIRHLNPHLFYKGTGNPDNLFEIHEVFIPHTYTFDEFEALTDFNGDGKADILRRIDGFYLYYIYSYIGDYSFTEISNIYFGVFDENILPSYVDLNNDGKTDFCFTSSVSSQKYCYFSFGEGFTSIKQADLNIHPSLVMDMNNDGLADYIELFYNGSFLRIQYGMPDGYHVSGTFSFSFDFSEYETIDGIYGLVLADIDGNGVQDLVTEFYEEINPIPPLDFLNSKNVCDSVNREKAKRLKLYLLQDSGFSKDLITSFKDGFGKETQVTYKPSFWKDETIVPSDRTSEALPAYPLIKSTERTYWVNSTNISDGTSDLNVMKYSFGIPMMHCLGKGFLGFTERTVINLQNQTLTKAEFSIFNQGAHYFFSYPNTVKTYTLIYDTQPGTLLMESSNVIDVKVFQNATPPVYEPVMTVSLNKTWENDMQHSFIKSSASFISIDDIDNYGNLAEYISCSDERPMTLDDPPGTYAFTNTQRVAYLIDEEHWITGRVSNSETISSNDSDPVDSEISSEFVYYEPGERGSNGVVNWPLLKQKTTVPNHENLMALREIYSYDMYGNIFELKKTAPNSSPPLPEIQTIFDFDEDYDGRFLTSKTEGSRNQPFITQYSYDEMTGQLLSLINPQGLVTNYNYDCFGRLYEIDPPDHIKIQTHLSWCAQREDAPAGAVFSFITNKLLYNSLRSESESVTTYYNKLGQDIRTVSKGINGSTIYTDKLYDSNGRLWKAYEPYFSQESPNHCVEYGYDELGRIDTTILPANTIVTNYLGRNIMTTDQGTAVSTTKKVDAIGNTIEITDPSGVIQYSYYSSGLVRNINVSGILTEMLYDAAGNQIALEDPDAGTTTYTYNAYGLLTSQTDAKGNTYNFTYDELNRLYEKSLFGVGLQARYSYYDEFLTPSYGLPESIEGTDHIRYAYEYDCFGRLQQSIESMDGIYSATGFEYSAITGKLQTITYPSAFQVQNIYDESSGDLIQVKDIQANKILWQLNAVNAKGQLTNYSLGNGLYTDKTYDEFGYPAQINTIKPGSQNGGTDISEPGRDIEEYIQSLRYSFDPVTGNLSGRSSSIGENHHQERFRYDDLLQSRLTCWEVDGGRNAIQYFDNGNIKTKTGITSDAKISSEYRYIAGSMPHAVTKVTMPTTEFRDHSTPQDIVYTAFNKIKQVTQFFPAQSDNPGDQTWNLDVIYGPDEQRKITRLSCNHELLLTKYFSSHLYEVEFSGRTVRKLNYIYGGDGLFAIYVMNGENDTMYYIHKDYLGSYDVITDEGSNVMERLSFDPWGRRRNATNWTFNNLSANHLFDRGYTGHEHLDVFSLINMNGRVYDPWLGRFLSPDPFVQSPGYSQSYNRYSYCFNNPLKYSDPSGYTALEYIIDDLLNSPHGGSWSLGTGTYHFQSENEARDFANGDKILSYERVTRRNRNSQTRMNYHWVNPQSGWLYKQPVYDWVLIDAPEENGSMGEDWLFINTIDGDGVPQEGGEVPAGPGDKTLPTWLSWTNIGINAGAYGTYEVGGTFRLVKSGSISLRWYKSGWITGNQYVKTTYSMSKLGTSVGYGTSFVGVLIGGYNFSVSDKSWGDYGQLGVSLLSAGLTCFPATTAVGIGIGVIDLQGGFNGFYNYLDGNQQLYNNTGIIMVPSTMGFPYFLKLK